MKVYNPVASGKASGRAFGGVFSFNRGLGTFKKYVKSRQPNTQPQQDTKTRLSFLTKYWKTNLTYAQITLWNNWVLPWTDIYGATVLLTGINKFVICNDTLLRAERPITETPPTATPAELTITETTDPMWIILLVDGLPDAEVTAQEPFVKIEVQGTPSRVEYIDGQLGIFWNGMPRSRRPLEKNWKTIFYYNCRTGFNGIEELAIIIQTDTSLTGLQPIRLQRFNKWGYFSGKQTYINPITIKNLIINGDFYTSVGWTITGGCSIHDGKAYYTATGELRQAPGFIAGRTYQVTYTIKFSVPGGWIALMWQNIERHRATDSGTFTITLIASGTSPNISWYCGSSANASVDNIFLSDIT